MTAAEPFATMLAGGHHNSLGRTIEVVDLIFADSGRLEELYGCYFDDDEVVRLRTSNAFKRVWREKPLWVVPYIDRFIEQVAQIEQASANWTVAQLCLELDSHLTNEQRAQATPILLNYLENSTDWIVLNSSMQTLTHWAKDDNNLKKSLLLHLTRLAGDTRKSVAKTAARSLESLA